MVTAITKDCLCTNVPTLSTSLRNNLSGMLAIDIKRVLILILPSDHNIP